MTKRIRISSIGQGMFASERSVEIAAGESVYTLLVPEDKLEGNTLEVEVIADRGDSVLVDLPRETFTSGSRITVPKALLVVP